MLKLLSIFLWSIALTSVGAVADVPTLADCMRAVHADNKLSCEAAFQEYFEELDANGDGQLSSSERDVLFSTPIDDMILPVFFPEGSDDVCTFEHFCDSMVTVQFPELAEDADAEILKDFCESEQLIISETCEEDWNSLFPDRPVNADDQTSDVSMTKTEYRDILMKTLNPEAQEWDQEKFLSFMRPTAQTEHFTLLLDLTASHDLQVVKVQDYTEPVNNCVALPRRRAFIGIVTAVAVVVSSVVAAGVQTAATGGNFGDFMKNLAVHTLANTVTAVGCATAVGCVIGGAAGGISGALLESAMCGGNSACWKAENYLWAAGTGAAAGVAASYADEITSVGVDDAGAVFFYTAANGAIGAIGGGANAIYNNAQNSGSSSPSGGFEGWHRIGQWKHIGYGGCTYGKWVKIGTANSLKEAMSLAMGNDVCSQAGSVLFYSAYSYDQSWGVRCATHANFLTCTENNQNWQEYQFHTDVKAKLDRNTAAVLAGANLCPAVQTNVDFPGNDLNAGGMWGRVPGHLTREECAAWCQADSRCVGYTFVKTEPTADNCAVKSSWNEASKRAGSGCCDSQQITRGCATECPAIRTNVDFPGNDLNAGGMWGRVPGHLTREQCVAWCKADSRCVGYTFVKTEPSADNCAVKSSWNEASGRGSGCCDSQKITRGCVSVTACPAIQTNVDYPGNDLNAGGMWGRVPGHLTREQCAAWCKSDSRCVGYTFVKTEPSADNCAVKSSWNEASRRPGSGCCDSQRITKGCMSAVYDGSAAAGQCMSGNYDIGTVLRQEAHTIHVKLDMPATFNTYGRQWILNLGQMNTGANHWIWNSNSKIQFGRWAGEQIENVNILQCDSLTMVVDPTKEMKLFCKGQLVGTRAGAAPFDIQNANLAVAYQPHEQDFTGCVKQVRIFNRALSDDVVQQLN